MKIFAPCMQCQVDHGHPSFEPIFVDYYDDAVTFVTCSVGHKTAHLVQSAKFEILLESGATALLEGFTLEASVTFSIALERFYEFALRVVCEARGISPKLYSKMFAAMARQSERQLGAFILLYAIEFNEAYKPSDKIITFRNSIIHKGEIPTLEKAREFATEVYTVIVDLVRKLKQKHANHMRMVAAQSLQEKRAKVPSGTPVVTNSGTIFFNAERVDIEPDFAKALDAFYEARQRFSAAAPYMQALHDQLSQSPSVPDDA